MLVSERASRRRRSERDRRPTRRGAPPSCARARNAPRARWPRPERACRAAPRTRRRSPSRAGFRAGQTQRRGGRRPPRLPRVPVQERLGERADHDPRLALPLPGAVVPPGDVAGSQPVLGGAPVALVAVDEPEPVALLAPSLPRSRSGTAGSARRSGSRRRSRRRVPASASARLEPRRRRAPSRRDRG